MRKTTLKDVRNVISKWMKDNDDVSFIGSFVSFDIKKIEADADDVIKDDMTIGFGDKETVEIMLEELQKGVKKEKDEFINW